MQKDYGFLLIAVLINIFAVFFAGDIYPSSAKIIGESFSNRLQDNIQQNSVKLQALQGEKQPELVEPLPSALEQQEQQQEGLQEGEEKLDRELEIEPKNPEGLTGEEVPGPGERLEPESIDDNFPFQPPDEEIQFNVK